MSLELAALRRQFPIFANHPGGKPLHYLDNAAMAQVPRAVIDAMAAHDSTSRANVHRGLHPLAERADGAYDAARAKVARFLNAADPSEIVFTAGCTASINLVAQATGATLSPGDEVVVSRLEHHSNLIPWLMMAKARGCHLRYLPVTDDGRLDESRFGDVIGPRCRFVAVTHASNVTGAVSPVRKLAEAAHAVGAAILVDGAQAIAHGSVDVQKLGVDFYCFSGHKMFGPTGIGVLWGRRNLLALLTPPVTGGGMVGQVTDDDVTFLDLPYRFEAGTPPVTQAVGLAAALTWLGDIDRPAFSAEERRLTDRLLDGLSATAGVAIVGPKDLERRLPVVSFAVRRLHPHDICQILGERGVAVRGGMLCAQPLMTSLGLAAGVVRTSLALYNDDGDVDAFLIGLTEAIKVLT
ncbi:aminotransferase class V-fold PLP-dependent enzyme [Telmatospirillum sp.]|uniref:aminotransferase class V-fold PLP-dependent enzyme n=1 Tax=Telmatospirillum sp. TaxID=2079197 RepID=UPI00283FA0CA|nr:aminotransferase class V-fold PLP-dependent enzyme [Telmatospirillum sp.]MDR3437777.1 aminotransferase class V-fold PLP-dependent enzyme [Telmatospirillum sp.]